MESINNFINELLDFFCCIESKIDISLTEKLNSNDILTIPESPLILNQDTFNSDIFSLTSEDD